MVHPPHRAVSPAEVRSRIGHPIIDADGHWIEYGPFVRDALERIGGREAAEGFSAYGRSIYATLALSPEERRHRRIAQESWWALPTRNTRDRATAMMPKLLNERMDELGIDFAVLYPSGGLGLPLLPEAPIRQATCRAYNTFLAEYFGPYAARMTPAAVIPMHTPEEAIAELEHVIGELGLKAVMLGSLIRRPVPALAGEALAPELPWLDTLGLDSAHDYDPVWAKCEELGVAPSFHANGRGRAFGLRASPSNFVYNHIGHFAAANEAVCKSLFLAGVTRRFPRLRFAFLEGGVAWACQLLADLIGHWEKRNLDALEAVRPENLDGDLMLQLARDYGSEELRRHLESRDGRVDSRRSSEVGGLEQLDDFHACAVSSPGDIARLFVEPFYFGCEADDPLNAWAFSRTHNPLGVQLNTLFGSDVGHFDVPDMREPVPEAYEMVEDGRIDAGAFRDFVLTNPVRFRGAGNPRFFEGTRVAREAAAILATADPRERERGRRSRG